MARLPYLDPDEAEPRVAELLGKAPDLGIFRMVANAQGAFPGWLRFGGAMLDPDEFDPVLREFAITRVAAMTPGADYEWVQHAQITLDVGGTQEQLDAIKRGEDDAAVLGSDGQLVVRFTSQVVREASPDDETFAAMSARFTPREIIHLLLVIGQYMMLGRIMATTRIDLDPAIGAPALQRSDQALRDRPPTAG
ncbi:MAG TPA: carboxymuconolactone decarboxylase family protein [Solirubrobacteraceae bacterium]|nr:carboxymuconolactone decarboxylase family protein [Solirubrobacteraceae bacterium]